MENRYVEIYEFISAPLNAMLQAERIAHESTIDFIRKYGFKPNSNELEQFTFYYIRPGSGQKVEVKIPLLSLIPIPNLQIKEAQVDFDLNIHYEKLSEYEKKNNGNDPVSKDYKFRAAITSKEKENKDTQMSVKIKVEQADIPNGLTKLFQVMDDGTSALSESNQNALLPVGYINLSSSRNKLILDEDRKVNVDLLVQVFNHENNPISNIMLLKEHLSIIVDKKTLSDFTIKYEDEYANSKTDENGCIRIWIKFIAPLNAKSALIKVSTSNNEFSAGNAISFQIEES
ncbi:MAG: DUF2589 domain-containing protein [Bacteroidales bacterium]|nr:DUF2589 domain-containing protein [Bacteroidales bacterium]